MGSPRSEWVNSGAFIPENCALAGVKKWRDRTFVTVPRWTPGVPSTLNEVVYNEDNVPVLRPFPSLGWQDIRGYNPSAPSDVVLYVQSMEITPYGVMYVIDSGLLNLFVEDEYVWVAPALLEVDIRSGSTLKRWDLTNVSVTNVTFINDIVLDIENGFAYISDDAGDGGLIVVDLKHPNVMRRYVGESTMADPDSQNTYDLCGSKYTFGPSPSDGIALHPNRERLYYCALTGHTLYSLDATLFRNLSIDLEAVESSVMVHGEKASLSDGMAFTADGVLYYGNIEGCSVNYWDSSLGSLTTSNQLILQSTNGNLCNWPDTFGFDTEQRTLLLATNRLVQFINGVMDFSGQSGSNFHVLSYDIDALSYMYSSTSRLSPSWFGSSATIGNIIESLF